MAFWDRWKKKDHMTSKALIIGGALLAAAIALQQLFNQLLKDDIEMKKDPVLSLLYESNKDLVKNHRSKTGGMIASNHACS
ncbi:TPA: hypothetical protein HA371_05400 [Candidatus Woesearchaeota archaeon]|nr:hypothetical protein [Candidatus Woesearchaeota archaeon]HIJ14154.1 hypothetical protein [Candidatus Woesearchaeota archaeon]